MFAHHLARNGEVSDVVALRRILARPCAPACQGLRLVGCGASREVPAIRETYYNRW
jgi:hypothetical protein